MGYDNTNSNGRKWYFCSCFCVFIVSYVLIILQRDTFDRFTCTCPLSLVRQPWNYFSLYVESGKRVKRIKAEESVQSRLPCDRVPFLSFKFLSKFFRFLGREVRHNWSAVSSRLSFRPSFRRPGSERDSSLVKFFVRSFSQNVPYRRYFYDRS